MILDEKYHRLGQRFIEIFSSMSLLEKMVITSAVLIATIYSWLALLRYQAFNAGVFDLGVSSDLMYGVFHGSFTINGIMASKLIYVPFSLIYNLYPNQELLMIYQSFWLSIGAVILFRISKLLLKDEFISALIGLTYLTYYPLSSVYWFDFHYMSLFPTFFLMTVYFYLSKNRKLFLIMGILTSVTDLLAPIIVGVLAILVPFLDRRGKEAAPIKKSYSVSLLISAFLVFLFANLYLGIDSSTQYLTISNGTPMGLVSHPLSAKIGFVFRTNLPFLFISLFSPLTMILSVPYYALAFKNNYMPYLSTMFYQYPALFTAPLFLSSIYGLKNISNLKRLPKKWKLAKKISVGLLILNIFLFSLYSPLGTILTSGAGGNQLQSLLTGMNGSYETNTITKVTQNDMGLQKIINLIPAGSVVLIQNNMPQLTQKYNWILPDQLSPIESPTYVVTNPYSYAFTHYSLYSQGNYTMYAAINHLLSTSQYGVYAQWNGSVLYKRGYTGYPLLYHPFTERVTVSGLGYNHTYSENVGNLLLVKNQTKYKMGWYGPYDFLLPGNYTILLNASVTNRSSGNSFLFQVVSTSLDNSTQTILYSNIVNGSRFTYVNKFQNVRFNFKVSHYHELVEFRSFDFNWQGTFTLSSINVQQNTYFP